jgi:Flp pilus assembly pilin Flp
VLFSVIGRVVEVLIAALVSVMVVAWIFRICGGLRIIFRRFLDYAVCNCCTS